MPTNTKGGRLIIGIDDDSKKLMGIYQHEWKQIKSVLKKKTERIIVKEPDIQKEGDRYFVTLEVKELPLYDKPQFLKGVLYYRKGAKTVPLKFFEEAPRIFQRQQLFLYTIKGIKANLKKMAREKSGSFENAQFIEGLRSDISMRFGQKAGSIIKLLDEFERNIKNLEKKSISQIQSAPSSADRILDKIIDKFIIMYKNFYQELRG